MFFQMVVKKFSLQNVTRGPVGLTRIASLTLPYLGDFGTSTLPASIFSLFFELCQPNLVRGNNVQN